MPLEILSDLLEIIHYPIADFPLFAGIGKLSDYNQYTVGCHWHKDFEFNLVLEGTMDYYVNGEVIHLETGDGIFVNSKRLHYNYSGSKTNCKYLVLTISPDLFPNQNPIIDTYIDEKIGANYSDYIYLSHNEHSSTLEIYHQILKEINNGNNNPLETLSLTYSLLNKVLPLLIIENNPIEISDDWQTLNRMTEYIAVNYRENVTLEKIAKSGNICRSKCCQLFAKYIAQSPVEYLIQFRLKKSAELLINSSCPIVEVALKCGFNSQSYFTQMFKRNYGVSPKEYRKQFQE